MNQGANSRNCTAVPALPWIGRDRIGGRTINIAVLAHVDAGKTSLTERLLFDYGATAQLGSVNRGDTVADSGDIERERGITIRSAVVAFKAGDDQINLIDTPGHPDFIAEVDRALSAVDGVVLVVSAVEGVQAQTRVLERALADAAIPTLVFMNKVDRPGARSMAVIRDLQHRLALPVVSLTRAVREGTDKVGVLANALDCDMAASAVIDAAANDDPEVLARAVEGPPLSHDEIWGVLRGLVAARRVLPLYVGSALQGAGVAALVEGVRALLPAQADTGKPLSGRVFAIERGSRGERTALVRLYTGKLGDREVVSAVQQDKFGVDERVRAKVRGLEVVAPFANVDARRAAPAMLTAGMIGRVRGLKGVKVGAILGERTSGASQPCFHPPVLETEIEAADPKSNRAFRAALMTLMDEDPLIHVVWHRFGTASLKLYGEVQKEVIAERLRREFDVRVRFLDTKPLFLERLVSIGASEHVLDPLRVNEFWATVGVILEPRANGAGNGFAIEVPRGQMPDGFYRAIRDSSLAALERGLSGWPVADCCVRLVKVGHALPLSVAADFRNLTLQVVRRALEVAGTRLYEPCRLFELEVPAVMASDTIRLLGRYEADIAETTAAPDDRYVVTGEIPLRNIQALLVGLPATSQGQGRFATTPGRDRPYRHGRPTREPAKAVGVDDLHNSDGRGATPSF